MKFRAHDTFFIRKGWLNKGIRNVNINPDVFISRDDNPMDVLGIGANMVKAMRYWLQATGLTIEPTTGRRLQTLTDLGQIIFENDLYIEELGTLWLLHYNLVKTNMEATAWYFFFNEFNLSEFNRDDFVVAIQNYIRLNGDEVSERSIEDDFNCIISTYVPRIKSYPEKVLPESNIDCPLGELGLVDIVSKKEKIYKKSCPKKDLLHPLIMLAVIIDNAKGAKEVKISSLRNDIGNVGKVFNLDIISLTNLLFKIELLGYIKVIRTAGLDVIKIDTNMGFLECVGEYYRQINQ